MRYNFLVLKNKMAKLQTQLKERFEKIALNPADATGLAEWGSVGDTLDEIKDAGWPFARNPAPEWLVRIYRKARTTLREVIPLVIADPTDEYAARALVGILRDLDQVPMLQPETTQA